MQLKMHEHRIMKQFYIWVKICTLSDCHRVFLPKTTEGLKLHVSPSMYFTTILQKPIHDTFWDFLGKKWRFDNLGAKEFICRPKKEGTYYKQVQIIFAKITKDD